MELCTSFVLGICIKVELVSHKEEVCLVFSRFCQIIFQSFSIILQSYQQYMTILSCVTARYCPFLV